MTPLTNLNIYRVNFLIFIIFQTENKDYYALVRTHFKHFK